MIKLGEDIVEDGYVADDSLTPRIAARGIIFNDKKELLLVYCAHYNDYTFPGGKVENGEDVITGLRRECVEEVGAIIDNIKPYVRIVEKRAVLVDGTNVMESQYFMCDLVDTTTPNLMEYEKAYGYEARWISIEDVIGHNESRVKELESKKAYSGVVSRELRLLNSLLALRNKLE